MHTGLHTMALVRTNVTLPAELLRQVDELAGARGRSRYVSDAVARQVRLDRQRKVFEETYEAMAGAPGRMTDAEALAFARELRAGWDVQP
jgi:Arc/MetJ-type ribon-helix-helix transcriptional regulator